MRPSRVLCVAAVLITAACTSSSGGKHSGSASHAVSTFSGSAHESGSAPATTTVTSTRPAPSGSTVRKPVATAIGDPVTADLCAAIGLHSLASRASGLTATFDERQDPPGCAITLSRSTTAALALSVFAAAGKPKAAAGRRTRTESGQKVYVYPFDAGTGGCEREIAPRGLLLVIDSTQPSGAHVEQSTACAATDDMAARLARAVDTDAVPRLDLASPSLSDLDACAVVRRSGITSLPAFARGTLHTLSFGVGCQVRPASVFLFVNFVINAKRRPAGGTGATAGTHSVYGVSTTGALCSYFSTQGRTSDGQYEQVAMTATFTGVGAPPAQLCEQTRTALGRYLDAAGLS